MLIQQGKVKTIYISYKETNTCNKLVLDTPLPYLFDSKNKNQLNLQITNLDGQKQNY